MPNSVVAYVIKWMDCRFKSCLTVRLSNKPLKIRSPTFPDICSSLLFFFISKLLNCWSFQRLLTLWSNDRLIHSIWLTDRLLRYFRHFWINLSSKKTSTSLTRYSLDPHSGRPNNFFFSRDTTALIHISIHAVVPEADRPATLIPMTLYDLVWPWARDLNQLLMSH